MNLFTEIKEINAVRAVLSFCFIAFLSFNSFSQTCPVQASPATQTDLSLCTPVLADCNPAGLIVIDAFLQDDTPYCTPCVAGDPLSMNINLNIVNQSEDANVIGLFGNISNGTSSCGISMCSPALVPKSMTADGSGAQVVAVGPINYICGETLTLSNLTLVSAAAGATCPITCTGTPAQCKISIADLVMVPPAVPAACGATIIQACDDFNPCTVNDTEVVDACSGVVCMPCTGSGTAADCFVVNLIACNDYNPCTINDMQSIDACSGDICAPCTGTPVASCSIFINQSCNDNNPCTTNDIIVLDACSLEICEPCTGTLVDEPVCNPSCEVYNPATCSCDPIPIPSCNDYDCSTIDTFDPITCDCIHIPITPQSCDDGLCYTNDYFDTNTCNCVNEPIVVVDCDDNNCATQDFYNYNNCQCEHIDVCTNVTSGGWIGSDQGNCGAFDPAPLTSQEPAFGGCGVIEYMWLQSPINVPYYASNPNSPWTIIPYASGLTYDPPYQASGTVCYLRCARTDTCSDFPGESNVVCITVGTVQNCNDWNCTTEDYFNPATCECEYTVISNPSCEDNNCSTEGVFNPETCECEFTTVCNNVTFPGNIGGNQESCGPFNPAPITSLNLPAGGCGEIEYIWIQSHTNVFSGGGNGSPWSTIPGANGPSYDPGMVSMTTYYRRCARSEGCLYYIGESNIITVEIGSSATCDDGNCNTIDTFDPITCECIHIDNTPDCNDNDCSTEDIYDPVTCTCTYVNILPPNCDDNDCNTIDTYDPNTCGCVYTVIPPPDCDDNNCATTDLFDVLTCECVNVINPPIDCDDNDCSTNDIYNATTCDCEYENIILPDCDDNDCLTIDEYDPETCECTNTSIEIDNCDDNDCNTHDFYDVANCECVYEAIPPPNCDDNNCNTIDSYNSETCLCENVVIEIPDCDDDNCNTEDIYDVTICDCVYTDIPPPNCDDNDCNTEDSYDEATCSCIYTIIPPPDCDDGDCNTDDFYNSTTCECVNTISQVPDCDDNNCNTEDFYDVTTCTCVNNLLPPPNCDDNDCNTLDSYDETTCNCINELIPPPNCDDGNCNTHDSYDTVNCECINEPITPPDCDDGDCTTLDQYDETTCECVYTVIPQEIICNTVGVFDLILDDDGNGFFTVDDIDDGSSVGCDATPILTLDVSVFACNNVGINEVKLTVSDGVNSECCTAMVNVIDNNLPVILPGFCPSDVAIDCDADISDLSIYGDVNLAFLDDNCALSHTVTENAVFDLDGCGIGTITRTFTLIDITDAVVIGSNGQPLTCSQIITVTGSGNPISLADITWPPAQVDLECSDPLPTTQPIIDSSGVGCSNVSVTSVDVVINPNGACNYTIERTFTVIDVCQTPGATFVFTQVFNITDTTDPSINISPDDLVIDLNGEANECSTVVTLVYNVTDNCADPADLILDLDAPGLISQTVVNANGGVSFDVEFCTLDEDVTVTLTVDDGCGNMTSESFNVMVLGEDCITFNCQKFIYALEPDGSNDFIASDFPVVDNLCNHIPVEVSYDAMDIQDTLAVYGCDEIENNGLNPNINEWLYFWVNGELIDSCRVVIFFSNDPNGDGDPSDGWTEICGFTNFVGNVSGAVQTFAADAVSNTAINLQGSYFPQEITDNLGEYAFPIMELGGNYEVIPKKDGDYLNGVSTLDIILIQKHILSLKEFDSPYKHIAADVNKSNTVSSVDIITLRKLILGIYEELPNNDSWRMVDKLFEFPDPTDPLNTAFPESYTISEMPSSMFVEFIGIKIGDVNGSVKNEFASLSSETRSDNKVEIGYQENHFKEDDEFEITLTPSFKAGFEGVQFAIEFDPTVLEIEDVMFKDNALCNIENLNLNYVEEGKILVSYNTLINIDSSDNRSLFTVRVNAIESSSVSQATKILEEAMPAESYFYNMVGDLVLMPRDNDNGGVILYQNKPNPWSVATTIQYFVPEDLTVTMNIYSINGQIIRSTEIESKAGMNEYQLSGSELNTTGVFYYELITDGSKQVRKMLLLE